MNKVILVGRLTDAVNFKSTTKQDGTQLSVATYTLAVDRRGAKEGQQQADFIRCKCFDSRAEFAQKYLSKGMKIAISGKIQTGSYTNDQGVKVYTTDVLVEEHEFCDSKNAQASQPAAAPQPSAPDDFMNIPDGFEEELPFN